MAKHRVEDLIHAYNYTRVPERYERSVVMVEKGQVYRFYHKDLHDESSGFFPTGMYVSQTKVIRPTPITCGRHSKEHIERGGYQKINLTLHLSPGPPSITFD